MYGRHEHLAEIPDDPWWTGPEAFISQVDDELIGANGELIEPGSVFHDVAGHVPLQTTPPRAGGEDADARAEAASGAARPAASRRSRGDRSSSSDSTRSGSARSGSARSGSGRTPLRPHRATVAAATPATDIDGRWHDAEPAVAAEPNHDQPNHDQPNRGAPNHDASADDAPNHDTKPPRPQRGRGLPDTSPISTRGWDEVTLRPAGEAIVADLARPLSGRSGTGADALIPLGDVPETDPTADGEDHREDDRGRDIAPLPLAAAATREGSATTREGREGSARSTSGPGTTEIPMPGGPSSRPVLPRQSDSGERRTGSGSGRGSGGTTTANEPSPRRRRQVIALALTAALGLIGGVAVLFNNGGPGRTVMGEQPVTSAPAVPESVDAPSAGSDTEAQASAGAGSSSSASASGTGPSAAATTGGGVTAGSGTGSPSSATAPGNGVAGERPTSIDRPSYGSTVGTGAQATEPSRPATERPSQSSTSQAPASSTPPPAQAPDRSYFGDVQYSGSTATVSLLGVRAATGQVASIRMTVGGSSWPVSVNGNSSQYSISITSLAPGQSATAYADVCNTAGLCTRSAGRTISMPIVLTPGTVSITRSPLVLTATIRINWTAVGSPMPAGTQCHLILEQSGTRVVRTAISTGDGDYSFLGSSLLRYQAFKQCSSSSGSATATSAVVGP